MAEENKSLDILGIKGISDSIKIATEKCLDGAAAFLSRVCLPAAEEFGLALQDRVSAWRARNAARMLNNANELHLKYGEHPDEKVNPRLVHLAIEEASWTDDDEIQEMWAGLFASSASLEGSDENLTFMHLLRQLSSLQVRILRYAVENAEKVVQFEGLCVAETLSVEPKDLPKLFEVRDLNRIDRELDHLVSIGLVGSRIGGGILFDAEIADLTPTALALHLYVRGQGSKQSPADFWRLEPPQPARNGPDEEMLQPSPSG
jgi:hypothetical protein